MMEKGMSFMNELTHIKPDMDHVGNKIADAQEFWKKYTEELAAQKKYEDPKVSHATCTLNFTHYENYCKAIFAKPAPAAKSPE